MPAGDACADAVRADTSEAQRLGLTAVPAFAGVAEQLAPDVRRYRVGEGVYGFPLHATPTVRDGSWPELIVAPEDTFVARKPNSLDFAAAAAAPLANITAMAAVDALEL